MILDLRTEKLEVVDGALSVRRSNNVCTVKPKVIGNLSPCSFNSSDGVGECTVLRMTMMRQTPMKWLTRDGRTISKRTASTEKVEDGMLDRRNV